MRADASSNHDWLAPWALDPFSHTGPSQPRGCLPPTNDAHFYRASSAYYASTKPCSPRRQTEGRRTAKDPERGSGLSKCHASSGSPPHHASSRRVVGLWKRRQRGCSTPAGSTDVSSRDSSFCPVKCGFVARCQSDAEFVSRLWASCGGGCCPPASQEKERQPFIQNARSAPVFRRLRIRNTYLPL